MLASLLGCPYPGGPHIERLARGGDPLRYPFKAGRIKNKPLHFSFSGLKTAVYTAAKNIPALNTREKNDLAASFERAALGDIAAKINRAAALFPCRAVYFGGGVTANQTLRALMESQPLGCPLYWPPLSLTGDNGAMIAGLGFHLFRAQRSSPCRPFPRMAALRTGKN